MLSPGEQGSLQATELYLWLPRVHELTCKSSEHIYADPSIQDFESCLPQFSTADLIYCTQAGKDLEKVPAQLDIVPIA